MHLARGQARAAAEDAARELELAREGLDPQVLHPALVSSASVELASGHASAAARHADELLSRWLARPGQEPRESWVVELALVLLRLGRGGEFVSALSPAAKYSPWVQGALALADERPLEAAEIFSRMGSRPSAALAQLEAGRLLGARASGAVDAAVAFWRSVGATAYLNEAKALRAAAS